jgi:hypothetical protein
MHQLANKTYLARNMKRMGKRFPLEYDFSPMTWVIPKFYKQMIEETRDKPNEVYIVKPELLSQGQGIFLTSNLKSLYDPSETMIV